MHLRAPLRYWPASILVGLVACGDDGRGEGSVSASAGPVTITNPATDDTGAPTGSEGTATPTSGGSGGDTDTGPACGDESCPDGECIADACCPAALACSTVCCADGQVCSFQQCVVPGVECIDATECPEGSYCEYSLGDPGSMGGDLCQGGAEPATGKCLPSPPECPPGVEPEGEDIDCLPQCEVVPQKSFEPVLKYAWTGGDVMMPPIVLQLDDDNCDQIVDERDIPEIVFSSFEGGDYNNNGTLRAVSVKDGAFVEKWSAKRG